MKIIGLTGGIGSGKSTVLELFQKLGTAVFIADVEAKKIMNSNVELIEQINELFGELAYINNELNRSYIASIVFKNKNKLAALNKLVHPKLRDHFDEFVKNLDKDIVIYEAAILFESGSDKMCDYIITVTANFEDKIERVMKRDNVSREQILERMNHQLKDDIKINNSHFIVVNNYLKDTELQVSTIYDLIIRQSKKL